MDSKFSTLTGLFFWGGGKKDAFKNFHLNWPNVFFKKYGFKNVHLSWLNILVEKKWVQTFPL